MDPWFENAVRAAICRALVFNTRAVAPMEDGQSTESSANAGAFGGPQSARPDFLELLVRTVPYDYRLRRYRPRKAAHDPIVFEVDDSHRFRNSVAFAKSGHTTITSLGGSRPSTMREFLRKRAHEAAQYRKNVPPPSPDDVLFPIDVVAWEKEIEDLEEMEEAPSKDVLGHAITRFSDKNAAEKHAPVDNSPAANHSADDDGWEDTGEHNAENSPAPSPAQPTASPAAAVLVREYVNNLLAGGWEQNVIYDKETAVRPRLVLYADDPNLIFERVEEKKKRSRRRGVSGRSRYCIGNDRHYIAEGRKVSLGTFGVQHAPAALRLDSRFYRANLRPEELRSFHRPPFRLRDGSYGCQTQAGSHHPNTAYEAHTLTDGAPFRIIEYAEEDPFFVVNAGMVSLLRRYYRNNEGGDNTAPSGSIVLEPGEEAPFFGFGDVRAGTAVQTLANNLFVSPVAPHRSTDFLCVVEESNITVRPVETVLLAGQQLPKEEVFAPHSRRLNQFCKDRLRVAAHRAFVRGRPLLMADLDAAFPYFSEGSRRKWLKEYADCVKKGRDNVWVLRAHHPVLGEEDLRKLVTPEAVCQYESMLACEARISAGGGENARSAPAWTLSRNFVNAANSRGLLELTNSGSTGFDDCFFCMRRVRLRKGNEAENRRILAEHQASYRERIDRIWAAQLEFIAGGRIDQSAKNPKAPENAKEAKADAACRPEARGGADSGTGNTQDSTPSLVIRRTYRENGVSVRKLERVSDPRVIKAYLKARRKGTLDRKNTLTCSNCGQSGHMKTNKTCPNYVSAARGAKKRHEGEQKRAKVLLQDLMGSLVARFMAIPFSNAFHRPVSLKKFPNYALVVRTPVDLGTVRANVRNFKYRRFEDFVDEFRLMRDNCALYNGPSHSLTEIAESIYRQATEFAAENSAQIREAEEIVDNKEGGA